MQAYDELVFHNPEYCSQCHRPIRTYDDYRPDVGPGGTSKYAPEERYRRAYDGVQGYRRVQTNTYGYRPLYRSTTYCRDCGSQAGRANGARTLSESDALDAARALVAALDKHDVPLHRGALYYVVKAGKSRRSLQGHDSDLFRTATAFGIQVARRRRSADGRTKKERR